MLNHISMGSWDSNSHFVLVFRSFFFFPNRSQETSRWRRSHSTGSRWSGSKFRREPRGAELGGYPNGLEEVPPIEYSMNFPAYPQTLNQHFMKELLSSGVWGCLGVCYRGMLGFYWKYSSYVGVSASSDLSGWFLKGSRFLYSTASWGDAKWRHYKSPKPILLSVVISQWLWTGKRPCVCDRLRNLYLPTTQ